jgi:undecaprenyl-diphosphatase
MSKAHRRTIATLSPMSGFSTRVQEIDDLVDARWEPLRQNSLANRIFYGASNLGDFSLIWHLIGGVRALHPRRRAEEALEVSVIMTVESILVNGMIKRLFKRSRPGLASDNPTEHHLRQPLTSSFPSGHASAAFTAAAVLSRGSRVKPLYYVVAMIVAASRIHVRLHHVSDVAGGVVTGIALGRVASRALDELTTATS